MNVEVQRLDPLKSTIEELDRSPRCVQQTVNRVCDSLVAAFCLLFLLFVAFYYFSSPSHLSSCTTLACEGAEAGAAACKG